jgi:hypothetical protein
MECRMSNIDYCVLLAEQPAARPRSEHASRRSVYTVDEKGLQAFDDSHVFVAASARSGLPVLRVGQTAALQARN